jgi:dolichol-phosphate mannosyltransferase
MRQKAFKYERAARFAGETNYPLAKMIKFAIDAITGFSIRPLRLASYFAIIFGILAFSMLIYVLVQYFIGNNVEGWTSLAVIVLLIGSVNLFVAGVLGEYLGRLYIQSKGRPLYIIQEMISSKRTKKKRI